MSRDENEMPPGDRGEREVIPLLDEESEDPADRDLRARLQALPLEAEPPRDLWPHIRARLRPRGEMGSDGPAGRSGVGHAGPFRPRAARRPRGPSLSWGTTVAAGVVLIVASGTLVWLGMQGGGRGPEPAVVEIPAEAGAVGFAAAEGAFGEYELALSDLRRILEASSHALEPETVQVLEESLAAVELALAEARDALLADPSGEMIGRLLGGTLRRRLGVLRQAVVAAVAQS